MSKHDGREPGRVAPEAQPLPLHAPRDASGPVRLCIVSSDLVGPVRNGGVGTAFTALGVALAEAGHQVTLLYVGGSFCENGRLEDWVEHYRKMNIEFVPLPETPGKLDATWSQIKAYQTYEWLKRNDRFDVVHFTEWLGNGYFALLARKQGLYFRDSLFCVTPHGPSFWHKSNNDDFVHRTEDVELDFMERRSVALADVVVSPSHYLLRWMTERGWTLPERTYVQQYLIPQAVREHRRDDNRGLRPINELVFFGRLETRKGLVLFCDALDRMVERQSACPETLYLTFLGKVATIAGEPADAYIRRRCARWGGSVEIITDLDQAGVLRYLEQPGRLAVIPSLADNLPNTVLECLGGGIPMLAAATGGIPEQIAAEDHERTLFDPVPDALADKLAAALSDGAAPSRFAVDVQENETAWIRWHESVVGTQATSSGIEPGERLPMVSICMPHHDRPHYLRQALESIRALDYPQFELLLVDDGSRTSEAHEFLRGLEPEFAQRGWSLIRQENAYPGAARNNAARRAKGEFLLFMDDDNYAKPHELLTFARAQQRTGADLLTCFSDVVTTRGAIATDGPPELRWLALGGPVSAGLFRNVYGDTNAFVRKDAFQALGGFHELRGVGLEDWELWTRADLRGYRVMVVPEALFFYRVSGDGVNTTTPIYANRMQVLEPYFEEIRGDLHPLVVLAQGLELENRQLHRAVDARAHQAPDPQQALIAAARTIAAMGEIETAGRVWSFSMRLASERRDGPAALESLLGSAEMFLRVGQPVIAKQSLLAAEKIAVQLDEKQTLEMIRESLSRITNQSPTAGSSGAHGQTNAPTLI